MDFSDPTRAVTPTLDGPVLAVLAQSGHPLTAGEVAARAARGSEIGVRRALGRLVEQGIVRATEMGRNRVHELNREHVAAPAADLLAGLRLELWKRLREELAGWNPEPLHASVFGSGARGDGGLHSDVDLLLVHRPVPGEQAPRQSPSVIGMLTGLFAALAVEWMTDQEAKDWRRQIDRLHGLVHGWTGNALQVVEMSVFRWADRAGQQFLEEVDRDAVVVGGHRSPFPIKQQRTP